MDTFGSLAIVAFAALIHASFQLSVSVLTLLSGHAIGSKHSHAKIMRLTTSYVGGATIMTVLLLAFICLIFNKVFGTSAPEFVWTVACGLVVFVGIAVWAFYYRKEKGTALWIPRSLATYLSDRSKATKQSAEAFGLGLSSVIAEIIFIIFPIIISSLVLIHLSPTYQLVGIGIYTVISMFSLVTVWGLIGSGHALSSIQRWREKNKTFLQFSAGSGLFILGFYIFVNEVLAHTSGIS